MRSTTQITWQNLSPSDDIEANIREHITKLAKFSDRIVDCRVTIEVPHCHHDRGKIDELAETGHHDLDALAAATQFLHDRWEIQQSISRTSHRTKAALESAWKQLINK